VYKLSHYPHISFLLSRVCFKANPFLCSFFVNCLQAMRFAQNGGYAWTKIKSSYEFTEDSHKY